MSIQKVLGLYGFTVRADGSLFWGVGSLVWGCGVTVSSCANAQWLVSVHRWDYNCNGDCVEDTFSTAVLHAGDALAHVFKTVEHYRSFWKSRL